MDIVIGDDFIHIKALFKIVKRNMSTPLELNAEGENSITYHHKKPILQLLHNYSNFFLFLIKSLSIFVLLRTNY
jgi:hypothetical protein